MNNEFWNFCGILIYRLCNHSPPSSNWILRHPIKQSFKHIHTAANWPAFVSADRALVTRVLHTNLHAQFHSIITAVHINPLPYLYSLRKPRLTLIAIIKPNNVRRANVCPANGVRRDVQLIHLRTWCECGCFCAMRTMWREFSSHPSSCTVTLREHTWSFSVFYAFALPCRVSYIHSIYVLYMRHKCLYV